MPIFNTAEIVDEVAVVVIRAVSFFLSYLETSEYLLSYNIIERSVTMDTLNTGNFLFQFGPIFLGIVFIIVIGGIIFSIVKGISQWQKNNNSPRLTVYAVVTSKRTHISRRTGNEQHHTHTSYYVTFEFESGDRLELKLSGMDYGQLRERDKGFLTFQGTRYHGFERESN